MSDKIPTIKIPFIWSGFNPDHRAYKPSNPQITCSLVVVIDVPLSSDLIVNAERIISAQLTNQDEETPKLTPLGMRYCIDQFESAMSDGGKETKEEEKEDITEDWDDIDEEETPKTKQSNKPAKSKKSEDDWDDDLKTDDENKSDFEKWNEDWES